MKYLFALVFILAAASAHAQELIEVSRVDYHPQNVFYIEFVEDLRLESGSIAPRQIGMVNAEEAAVLKYDLDDFLKKYFNSALDTHSNTLIHIKVLKFWIAKHDSKKGVGKIETEFEIYKEERGSLTKIAAPKYYELFPLENAARDYSGKLWSVFGKLIREIDFALMPGESSQINRHMNLDVNDAGGTLSLGIAIGGGGLVGVPLRVYPMQKLAFEIGLYYRPTFAVYEDYNGNVDLEVYQALMIAGGLDIFVSKKKEGSYKTKMQGLFLKSGYSLSEYPEAFGAIGWSMERIKGNAASFSASAGLGVIGTLASSEFYYPFTGGSVTPLLYFKVQWSWYLVKYRN